MAAKSTNPYRTTYHRDRTVTYWSVHAQRWIRRTSHVARVDWPTFDARERERIARHLDRDAA